MLIKHVDRPNGYPQLGQLNIANNTREKRDWAGSSHSFWVICTRVIPLPNGRGKRRKIHCVVYSDCSSTQTSQRDVTWTLDD
ncbi:hypothetical protein F2P79_017672 [Pimephales promelas]|nr:hypothetical protein F2P79_017672 [Pimephales promelas]